MASLIHPLALSGSRKADGSVNAGGRVFLTQVGSQTPVIGYLDSEMNASHALDNGGILLDSAGKASIFINERCDVRIEDAAGAETATYTTAPTVAAPLVEIHNTKFTGTDENGQPAVGARTDLNTALSGFANSLGGTDGNFRGTYGTVDRAVFDELEDPWINAKRFGATGDGQTDDTAALATLFASASNRRVFLPKGTYVVSQPLNLGSIVALAGVGASSSSILNTNTTGDLLVMGPSFAPAIIENLRLRALTVSTGAAINCSGGGLPPVTCRGLMVSGHRTGMTFSGSANKISIADCDIATDNNAASRCLSYSADGFLTMIATNFNGAVLGVAVEIAGGLYATAIGCLASGGVSYSLTGAARGLTLIGGSASSTISLAGTSSFVSNLGCDIIGTPQVADTVAEGTTWRYALANGGTVTVTERFDTVFKIRATGAGAGTIASTTKLHRKTLLSFILFNNSGGAFTFNFSASFSVSSAPAPANGTAIGIIFAWNETQARYNELARSAAYTP